MTSFWRHFKYLRIVTKFRGSYCDCNGITNQAGIALGHEQTFHSRFALKQVKKQVRRKLMRLRRVTFHMTIYSKSPISSIWKIKHDFFGSTTTFRALTAQILVLQPRRQLDYLNSNLMLRWDGHFKARPTRMRFSCVALRSVTMRPCIYVDASWRIASKRMKNASVWGRGKFTATKNPVFVLSRNIQAQYSRDRCRSSSCTASPFGTYPHDSASPVIECLERPRCGNARLQEFHTLKRLMKSIIGRQQSSSHHRFTSVLKCNCILLSVFVS